MKRLFGLALVVAGLMLAAVADAHFVWASVDGKSLRLEIAESPGDSVVPIQPAWKDGMHGVGVGPFAFAADKGHVMAPILGGRASAGLDLLYGIHGTSLIHWFAKGASSVEAASKPIGLASEVCLRRVKDGFVVSVVKDGKPASGAVIEASMPGVAKVMSLTTSSDGTVRLPASKAGMLSVGAAITVKTPGDFKGAHFDDRVDMCSLTVRV